MSKPVPAPTLYATPFGAVESYVQYLQGRVLTVVDAAISDPIQRKATKDLIKEDFSRQLGFIAELFDPSPRVPN